VFGNTAASAFIHPYLHAGCIIAPNPGGEVYHL
jgi:hypothetical protein